MSHKKRLQGLDCKRFHKERKINEKDLAAESLQLAKMEDAMCSNTGIKNSFADCLHVEIAICC